MDGDVDLHKAPAVRDAIESALGHNSHHTDPTCARHGVLPGQIDISARVIWNFEKLGWAGHVRWLTPNAWHGCPRQRAATGSPSREPYPQPLRDHWIQEGPSMFTMTESAIEAIDQLTAAQNVQAEGGLRLTLNGLPEDGAALDVEVAAHSVAGDDIIATTGTQVFLARETRVRLSDKVFDVRKDIDGHYTFLITTPT